MFFEMYKTTNESWLNQFIIDGKFEIQETFMKLYIACVNILNYMLSFMNYHLHVNQNALFQN